MSPKRSEENKVEWLRRLRNRIAMFGHEDDGVTAIEYALLAALIFVVILGAVGAVGTAVGDMWTTVANAVDAAI